MGNIKTITVNNVDVTINTIEEEDYVNLTEILKTQEIILNRKKPDKAIRKQPSLFTKKELSGCDKKLKTALDYKEE